MKLIHHFSVSYMKWNSVSLEDIQCYLANEIIPNSYIVSSFCNYGFRLFSQCYITSALSELLISDTWLQNYKETGVYDSHFKSQGLGKNMFCQSLLWRLEFTGYNRDITVCTQSQSNLKSLSSHHWYHCQRLAPLIITDVHALINLSFQNVFCKDRHN